MLASFAGSNEAMGVCKRLLEQTTWVPRNVHGLVPQQPKEPPPAHLRRWKNVWKKRREEQISSDKATAELRAAIHQQFERATANDWYVADAVLVQALKERLRHTALRKVHMKNTNPSHEKRIKFAERIAEDISYDVRGQVSSIDIH